MQINQKTSLEELAKEKWMFISAIGQTQMLYGRCGIQLAYDIVTQEVVTMYDSNLKKNINRLKIK